MLVFTGSPQVRCGNKGCHAFSFQNFFPSSNDFFNVVGIDILVSIREFLHHPKTNCFTCFQNLMMTSKTIYTTLSQSKLLNKIIARDAFSFNYLRKTKNKFKTYGDLIRFRDNITGFHLTYNECARSQFLQNSKLASKKPYVMFSRITMGEQIIPFGASSGLYCVRVKTSGVQIKKIKHLLTQFEQMHNGIALNIFQSANNHMPFNVHNNTIWVVMNEKQRKIQFPKKPFLIGLKIELRIVNFRYYFRFHFCNFFFDVSSSVSMRLR